MSLMGPEPEVFCTTRHSSVLQGLIMKAWHIQPLYYKVAFAATLIVTARLTWFSGVESYSEHFRTCVLSCGALLTAIALIV